MACINHLFHCLLSGFRPQRPDSQARLGCSHNIRWTIVVPLLPRPTIKIGCLTSIPASRVITALLQKGLFDAGWGAFPVRAEKHHVGRAIVPRHLTVGCTEDRYQLCADAILRDLLDGRLSQIVPLPSTRRIIREQNQISVLRPSQAGTCFFAIVRLEYMEIDTARDHRAWDASSYLFRNDDDGVREMRDHPAAKVLKATFQYIAAVQRYHQRCFQAKPRRKRR